MNLFCYYWLFGIPFDFTQEELQYAFQGCMKEIQGLTMEPEQKKVEIDLYLDIYNILSNEEKRKKYDFCVQIGALHIYEKIQTINRITREVIDLCDNRKYQDISMRARLEIKKTVNQINDILKKHQDIASYFEMHYLSIFMEYNTLQKKYTKKFSSSS